jgi:hypothetical protein
MVPAPIVKPVAAESIMTCDPTHHSGKPSSPPAIITATETRMEGPPPHVSALQSVAGEEGEALTMTTT